MWARCSFIYLPLLLIYHLFNSPEEAKKWLGKHNLECTLPKDVTVVMNKFVDKSLPSIWDFIFEQIASKKPAKSIVQPTLNQVQEVLGDRKLILIFDELEQGIGVISDPAIKRQNIVFLQMLSEWAKRDKQITIFAGRQVGVNCSLIKKIETFPNFFPEFYFNGFHTEALFW